MSDRLPLLSAQLAFALDTQRTSRRPTVSLRFRTPPGRLVTADVHEVLRSVVRRNPALSHRIRFSRGSFHQEWCPGDLDFLELHETSEDAAGERVRKEIDEEETAVEASPVSARLVRSPESDVLLLMMDHALVDEQSTRIITSQLDRPADPDGDELMRYRQAVHTTKELEDAAAAGPGITFWQHRLNAATADFPKARKDSTGFAPVTALPVVAIPRSLRGSVFPFVLFSIHRAARDLGDGGPTAVGYPWAARTTTRSTVVGCFLNTVISLDTTGPDRAPGSADEFVAGWYREIEHADVPFTAVAAASPRFTGSVTGYLGYQHVGERPLTITGVPAVQIPSSHVRTPPTCGFQVAAAVREHELELRICVDEEAAGHGAQEFGERLLHRLDAALTRG
ncbi:hypothetical protein JNUCC0626_47045 [Lentzea sp. JNUCC 0626]|uniref:hypothetical protein n=1 Tax=Lentzea sp. JNUCC 0626 TaxID=3367513 RepID=UPI00374A27E4